MHSLTCLSPMMNFPSWPYNLLMVNIFSRYFIESKQVALTLIYFPSILFCVQKVARLYQSFVLTAGIICLQLDACSSFIATFVVYTVWLLSCLYIKYSSWRRVIMINASSKHCLLYCLQDYSEAARRLELSPRPHVWYTKYPPTERPFQPCLFKGL